MADTSGKEADDTPTVDATDGDPLADSARIGGPITTLGGAFMLDPATIERGASLGLSFPETYGLGRAGVLGDVDADVVVAAFVFFEPNLVRAIWRPGPQGATAEAAAATFALSCQEWGRDHLDGVEGLGELCVLLERVVQRAPAAGLALFAAWRAVPLPDDHPARVAQLCHVLREHRGGNHGIAVLASRIDPHVAVTVNGGPDTATFYGWPEPHADPEDHRDAIAAAEHLTDRLASQAWSVLDPAERTRVAQRLDGLVDAAGLGRADANRVDDVRRNLEGE